MLDFFFRKSDTWLFENTITSFKMADEFSMNLWYFD